MKSKRTARKRENIGKHIFIVLGGIILLLGVPYATTDSFRALLSGNLDAVSSASVQVEQPSGNYRVLINGDMHANKENLETWVRFFQGEEIDFLFEDISCSVIEGDAGALTMAQSFQSRLPERQMSIQEEDATLLMSRADCGKYDIIILSEEFADAYEAETAEVQETIRLDLTGGSE